MASLPGSPASPNLPVPDGSNASELRTFAGSKGMAGAAASHGRGAPSGPDGTGLVKLDPWLEPYSGALRHRYARYRRVRQAIEAGEGTLEQFSRGMERLGFTRGAGSKGEKGVWYREWAPGAKALSLVGEFNGWKDGATPMERDGFGVWSCFLADGANPGFKHGCALKVRVVGADGATTDRIPAYITRVEFGPRGSNPTGVYWDPPAYAWKHTSPLDDGRYNGRPRIYEAHVGMATEQEKVGTFDEFRRDVLPRIARAGYNTVQLMAIAEHPYYGSFGYHVSNFFAVSSRFGTPEEFKALVDEAHGLGLAVIMDLVHSHSVKNTLEGLNGFDGTDHQYFHAGGRGDHPAWDSKLFDYDKHEVQRFLLSNVRFWLEEYRLDGYRFDGVTSMMYLDHGHRQFTSYDDYLVHNIDEAAVTYLQLANQVAHAVRPNCITIAEDVSGMVGIARPVEEGGIGFDYRLAMGLPDMWIKLLKSVRDEDWSMRDLFSTLANRRAHEKHIAYCESHDQALVGDKTLAFWLMDADMYWHMNKTSTSLVIDRGIALHKMIRLLTLAVGGEGWLNFMGNEFGHSEWVDFPREGNNWSHKYARRQWGLADHPDLRYQGLAAFDRAMMELEQSRAFLKDPWAYEHGMYDEQKLLFFTRGPLVFAFNFHATRSCTDLRVPVPGAGPYTLVMDSDAPQFGGFARVKPGQTYAAETYAEGGLERTIKVYLPSRSVQVYAAVRAAE